MSYQTTIELHGGPADGQRVPFNGGSFVDVALPTKWTPPWASPPGAPISDVVEIATYRVEFSDPNGFRWCVGVYDGGGQ